jgi:hypothetical protein
MLFGMSLSEFWWAAVLGIALGGLVTMFVAHKLGLFKKVPSPQELDTRFDSLNASLNACFYMLADNGKDTVVNRHLSRRADEHERKAKRLKTRADRIARSKK